MLMEFTEVKALSSSSREQTVSVVKNYTYDDGCEPCGTDTFMREPFVVMFSSSKTGRLWYNDENTEGGYFLSQISPFSFCAWGTRSYLM